MANTLNNYPHRIKIGENNGESIFLSAPSWDFGWYWGFGYLGNNNCHYHIDGLEKESGINMYDAFIKHFGKSLTINENDLWTICELFKTFYTLKEAAEVLGRGGSHFTTNPCAKLIKNTREVNRINEKVLPQIFEEIYKILLKSK